MVRWLGLPLPWAIHMASLNPARAMRLDTHKGSLEVGKDADLAIIDQDINIYLTMVRGHVVYQSPEL
jgi:N-acetylglucosamine-6-phosphate deacetylase